MSKKNRVDTLDREKIRWKNNNIIKINNRMNTAKKKSQ